MILFIKVFAQKTGGDMKKRIFGILMAITLAFSAMALVGCGSGLPVIGHEHTLEEISATEPTCVSEGNIVYYKCSECGEIFLDAEGKEPADMGDVILSMTAHDYAYVSHTETHHTYKCVNCGTSKIEPHKETEVSGRNVGHLYKTKCECGYGGTYEEIPTISISTLNGQEIQGNRSSAEYYDCTVSVSDCDDEYAMTDVTARVKVRGNYSADYSKKPYKIKFDSKQVMLGVNEDLKAKEWVLLADYKDRSLLRNPTVHYLADEMLGENGYYCTDSRYVEVYVNGTYRGLYLLVEQQEVREERVNVAEPEDPADYVEGSSEYEAAMSEIMTGYLVELDAYATEELPLERFSISYKNGGKYADGSDVGTYKFESNYAIKSKVYTQAQNDFIKKTIQNIYEVLADAVNNDHSDLNADPYLRLDENNNVVEDPTIKSDREVVEATIELDSLIDTFILNEICMDMDIGWSSFLMSIDMSESGSKKLAFQAPWDWDSALGFDVDETDDGMFSCMPYRGNSNSGTPKTYVNPWLTLLSSRQWFRDEVAQRYIELRERGVFAESINRLDEFSAAYKKEIDNNFSRWRECLTSGLGGNGYYNQCTTHESAKEYLKDFLKDRYAALDELLTVGNTWTS